MPVSSAVSAEKGEDVRLDAPAALQQEEEGLRSLCCCCDKPVLPRPPDGGPAEDHSPSEFDDFGHQDSAAFAASLWNEGSVAELSVVAYNAVTGASAQALSVPKDLLDTGTSVFLSREKSDFVEIAGKPTVTLTTASTGAGKPKPQGFAGKLRENPFGILHGVYLPHLPLRRILPAAAVRAAGWRIVLEADDKPSRAARPTAGELPITPGKSGLPEMEMLWGAKPPGVPEDFSYALETKELDKLVSRIEKLHRRNEPPGNRLTKKQ